jgi:hypothetical protein
MSQDTKDRSTGTGMVMEGDQSLPFAERTPIGTRETKERWDITEPKVTNAEELLYAEAAPLMRVLGGAVAESATAYSIACKLRDEFPAHDQLPPGPFANEQQVADLDKTLLELHEAHCAMRSAYRAAAKRLMIDERRDDETVPKGIARDS